MRTEQLRKKEGIKRGCIKKMVQSLFFGNCSVHLKVAVMLFIFGA